MSTSPIWGNNRVNTGLITPGSGVRWVGFLAQQTSGLIAYKGQNLILGDTPGNEMIQVGNSPGDPNPMLMGTGGSFGFFGGNATSFATGFSGSTTAMFALKYDYTAGAITMYFNPSPSATEGSLVAWVQ